MADSSGALQRPPSLKAFLDAGGDLAAPDIWEERLAEVVYLGLPLLPPTERAKRGAEARAKALDATSRRCGRRRRERQLQRERILYWHWVADLYEAPELAERLAAAFSPDIVSDFEAIREALSHPHPLVLRTPKGWWSCHNCGGVFDEDAQEQAVVVTGHETFSDLLEDITYCTTCVSALVAEAGH